MSSETATETAANATPPPPILSRAVPSRVGNTLGGLSPLGLTFPDGSPVRSGVPATAARVGVERDPTLLRIQSAWNEGGGHTVWVRVAEGRPPEQAGHAFDFGFDAPPFVVGLGDGATDRDREFGQTAEVLPVSAGGALIPAPADTPGVPAVADVAAADEAVGVDTAGDAVTPGVTGEGVADAG